MMLQRGLRRVSNSIRFGTVLSSRSTLCSNCFLRLYSQATAPAASERPSSSDIAKDSGIDGDGSVKDSQSSDTVSPTPLGEKSALAKVAADDFLKSLIPIERRHFAKGLCANKIDLEMLIYPEFVETDDLLELEDYCNKVKRIMKNHVDSRELDQLSEIPQLPLDKLKELRIFGALIPRQYGGLQFNQKQYISLYEALSADFSILTHWIASHDMVARSIAMFGSDEQKRKYLPGLASGELTGAFCLFEESAGNDIAAIKTEAQWSQAKEDTVYLNGTKQWVLNGRDADILLVFAKVRDYDSLQELVTVPSTCFIIDRRLHGDKIKVLNRKNTAGLRALTICDLQFSHVPAVPSEDRLGASPNGFTIANEVLRSSHYPFGVAASAFMKRQITAIQAHTNKDVKFDTRIAETSSVQKRMSGLTLNAYALDSMVYFVAGLMDDEPSRDYDLEGAMIRWFAKKSLRTTLENMEQLYGRRSAEKESDFERHVRDIGTLNTLVIDDDFLSNYIAMEGLVAFAEEHKSMVEKRTNPFKFPWQGVAGTYRHSFVRDYRPQFKHYLTEHFHPSFEFAAKYVEECMAKFEDIIADVYQKYEQEVEDDQFVLDRVAEITTLMFASLCCMSRASRSYSIGLRNADLEMFTAHTFCVQARYRIMHLLTDLADTDVSQMRDVSLKKISDQIHMHQGYWIESPLQRNCDPAMKQFLIHLNENLTLGKKFIIADLDDTRLFVTCEILPVLKEKVNDLMEAQNPDLSDKK